jgi:hypothetical protein
MFSNRGGKIIDEYGFNFQDTPTEPQEESCIAKKRLPDVPVTLKNGRDYTHRFVVADYEYDMVKMVGGQTYKGDSSPSVDTIVGSVGGTLFDLENSYPGESLYLAADCITGEMEEAITLLFTCDGKPKNAFKKKCNPDLGAGEYGFCKILYISDVCTTEDSMDIRDIFSTKDSMDQGLEEEMVRAMVYEFQDILEYCPDVIILSPTVCGMFEELGFQQCATRGPQKEFMFLQTEKRLDPKLLGTLIRRPNKRPLEKNDGTKENTGPEKQKQKHAISKA